MHHLFIYTIAKRSFLALSLLCFYFVAKAQRQLIDSTTKVIRDYDAEDTVKVQLLADQSYNYHLVYPDSTKILARQAYALSVRLNYEKGKADAMKLIAVAMGVVGDFDSAVYYNKEALASYEKIGEKWGKGAVLNNIAIILHNQGYYKPALTYYQQSLQIRQQIDDQKGVAGCYNNIGNTYSDMGNYAESLHHLFKALQIRERLGDSLNIANSLGNIAGVYLLLGKDQLSYRYAERSYKIFTMIGSKDGIALASFIIGRIYDERKEHEKALMYFTNAKRYYEEMENYPGLLVALTNIGEELTELNQLGKSRTFYQQAMALATEGQDQEGIAISNIGLGVISLKEGRIKESIGFLKNGLKIAMNIGNKLRISEASRHLANAYAKDNDFRSANQALQTFIAYKDSLFIEEAAKKAEEIQFNFILDKKQKEIALLEKDGILKEKENEKQRLVSLGLVSVLMILLLGIFFLLRNHEKEKKSKQLILNQKDEIELQARKLEELNALKDKTFSVLSHDLRSPVSSLIGVMNLMEDKLLTPEEFNSMQSNFNSQLRSLGYMLDNLLYWSKSHITGEHTVQKVHVNISQVVDQNTSLIKELVANKNIRLDTGGVEDVVAMADKDDVDIVMRNLLSNAVKFTNANGCITIKAGVTRGEVVVEVTDDGIGMDKETLNQLFSNNPKKAGYGTQGEKGTGIGLLICNEFIERNGGVLDAKSEPGKGTSFRFTLPVA